MNLKDLNQFVVD